MPVEIEYEPSDHALALDEAVQLVLQRFPPVGGVRPKIGTTLGFADGNWGLVIYTEGDTIRYRFAYADLTDPNSIAQRDTAHARATELVNTLAPRYFNQPSNLAKVEEFAVIITYQ